MLSPSGSVIGQSPGCTDRIVKYMANNPAKNMSSLDSHTMVPTLTMLGRFSVWIRELRFAVPEPVVVVVTRELCPAVRRAARPGGGAPVLNGRRPDKRSTTA